MPIYCLKIGAPKQLQKNHISDFCHETQNKCPTGDSLTPKTLFLLINCCFPTTK